MPVMDEQVRKERAERLLQLRFEEGLSAADAWCVVAPHNTVKDSTAAEQTRREIRRYRNRYCVVDAPGEDGGPEGGEAGGPNGASPNGTSAEVTGAAAAKPTKRVKRCLGAGDEPCGKEITGRSPRCEPCRAEHERLKRQVQNRDSNLRNKEARKMRHLGRRLIAALRCRLALLQEEQRRRLVAAEKRRQEEERQRQKEADRKKAILAKFRAEVEAKWKAEEERIARLPRKKSIGDGRFLTTYPDGRRTVHNVFTGRLIELQPGEPIPGPPPIKFADDMLPRAPEVIKYNWAAVDQRRRR